MNFTIDEKDGVLRLELAEELTVQHVGELKESLCQAMENGLSLEVRSSRLENTHTALIQLFLVWKRSGRRIDFVSPSPVLKGFMERLGIQDNSGI